MRIPTPNSYPALLFVLLGACGEYAPSPSPDLGELEIVSQTTGDSLDTDGYSLTVTGRGVQALGANASLLLRQLPPGEYALLLTGLAANCQVQSPNPRTVIVRVGVPIRTEFRVECHADPPPTPATGQLRVTVSTEGDLFDPDGYVLFIMGKGYQTITANGEVIYSLLPNTYEVSLLGVALHCTVLGPQVQAVHVEANTVTRIEFKISCPNVPPGSLLVTITTAVYGDGWGPLDWFRIRVDNGEERPIAPNGYLVVTPIAAGNHTVSLNLPSLSWPDHFFECTVTDKSTVSVWVPTDGIGRVSYEAQCIP